MMLKNYLLGALILGSTLSATPAFAGLASGQVEQYGRVLDNLTKAETQADIPDPIDSEPASSDSTSSTPEPSKPSDDGSYQNEHPRGPF